MSRGEETRRRILEAALEALEQDPMGLNMGRVAEIAGISRQAVYLHFADRAALTLAAAQYVDERFDLEKHLAPMQRAETGEELLAAAARFLADYNPLIYPVVRAADAARRSDEDTARAWNDRLANRRAGTRYVITRLKELGELSPEWTVTAASDWLTAQFSVKVWEELVLDLRWSRKRYVEGMTRAFVRALLTR